jgi:hypothetical protein
VIPQGLKPGFSLGLLSARLKSCPDASGPVIEFFAAREVAPGYKAYWFGFVLAHPFAKCAKGWGTLSGWADQGCANRSNYLLSHNMKLARF